MKSEISIIIAKPLLKTQLYNGIKPSEKHILTKKLANALFSKRWEVIPLDGTLYYKVYVDDTKYRAVVEDVSDDSSLFLLIFFRSKDDPASENISKYQNYSSQVLRANKKKSIEAINQGKIMRLKYSK